MPFEDGEFDGVTCRVAAHHFLDVPQFVSEVRRVLKVGGWFLLVDTVSPEDDEAARTINEVEAVRDPSHVWNLKVSAWESLFSENGFVVSHSETNRKILDMEDWMERMRVPAEIRPQLRARVMESEGAVRDYFHPRDGEFDLLEGTVLGVRSS